MSGIWAVVPVKELTDAKQRLSSRLSLEERRTLATVMLEDVLDAVSAVSQLAGILIGTIDPVATSFAAPYGARIVGEGAREGHTGAVGAAARLLVREGRAGMMTLPGDIPRVSAAEIAAALARIGPPPPSPSCRRTTSSVRRRTPFHCVSAKTASTPISTRREPAGSSR